MDEKDQNEMTNRLQEQEVVHSIPANTTTDENVNNNNTNNNNDEAITDAIDETTSDSGLSSSSDFVSKKAVNSDFTKPENLMLQDLHSNGVNKLPDDNSVIKFSHHELSNNNSAMPSQDGCGDGLVEEM